MSSEKTFRPHEIIIEKEISSAGVRHWTRTERRKWVMTLFFGTMTLYMVRTVMPVCAVAMSKEFEWDKSQVGFVLSIFFWGYAMTQALGGYLSDRFGGDRVISVTSVGWILLTVATPRLPDIVGRGPGLMYLNVAIRWLMGVSQGFFYPSLSSILAKRVPATERAMTFCMVCCGAYIGTLLTGSVGSMLVDYVGWSYTFYAAAVCASCWLLVLRYCVMEEPDRHTSREIMRRHRQGPRSRSLEKTKPEDSQGVPWLKLFKSASFWALLCGHMCQSNAFLILLSWLPTYFHETFPDAKGWVFNVVPWVMNIISSLLCGWLADKLISAGFSVTRVRKSLETVSLVGIASSLCCITLYDSYTSALVCMGAALFFSGFHNGAILSNPGDIAPKYAGAVFGLMNTAGAIPGFVGVYIAGHILETTHSWSAVFNQTAVVALVGWVVFTAFGTGNRVV